VIDPPRAGARVQAEALAASRLGRLALVSCNPATFARDARILVDGGWHCLWVRPIDAFLWSSRIELVSAFARPAKDDPRRSM
jgi:23S rRNA (uracil1939-C5)-methyltransferase